MQRQQSFFKEFSHLAIGTFLNLLIGVITTPVLTRIVEPEMYGQYSLFNTYVSIAAAFFTLGLDQAMVRYFYGSNEIAYKKKILMLCISTPITAVVITCLILLGFYPLISKFTGIISINLIWMFFASILASLINRFGMLLVRLQYKTKIYALINTLHRLVYLILAVPLVLVAWTSEFYALAIAGLASSLICILIEVVSEKKVVLAKQQQLYNNDHLTKSELMKFGFPLMIAGSVMYLFQAADKICIRHFGTYSDVGVYASAQSLMAVFNIITTSFNTLYAPKAIEHYEKNPDDTSFYQRMNQIITVMMFGFGATVLLCKDLFVLLLGEKYRAASMVIPFLMFNPIMYTVSETTVQGIMFKKKTGSQAYITLTSCALNYLLNILLIPRIGLVGASMATGISYIVFFTLRTAVSNHYYKIKFGLKRYYLTTLLFFMMAAYHSKYSFDIYAVIIYILFMVFIFICYKNSVSEILVTILGRLKSIFRGKE